MTDKKEVLLEISEVKKEYKEKGLFNKNTKRVLNGVSFTLEKGKCLGIIGES